MSFDYEAAVLYDLMNPPQFEPDQIDFHLHHAIRARNVLDFGAGTGRVAIPLAEHRVNVTCFDKFAGMLAALVIKVAGRTELHPFVTPVSGDPLTIDLKKQFTYAYMSRVLFYLPTDEERVALFRNVAKHIEPNGVFCVDAPMGSRLSQPKTQTHKIRLGRYQYTVAIGYERQGGTQYKGVYTFTEHYNGELMKTRDSHFDAADIPGKNYMIDLFNEAGLTVEEIYADHKFKPYPSTGEADYGIFLARKK
ncbi:MAG: class I SAM-dependent methyltransferase [Myxococcaceae bacterium]|nr:class I SAM-dependent methyltransferase [Myxococcaceae bacterium]